MITSEQQCLQLKEEHFKQKCRIFLSSDLEQHFVVSFTVTEFFYWIETKISLTTRKMDELKGGAWTCAAGLTATSDSPSKPIGKQFGLMLGWIAHCWNHRYSMIVQIS